MRVGLKRRDEYNKSNPYRDSNYYYILVDHKKIREMKGQDMVAIGAIVIGLILVIIPDPATTAAGLLLILAGFGISEAK